MPKQCNGSSNVIGVVLAIVCSVALTAGCSSDDGAGSAGASTLTLVTYNAGLAYNFVPLAKERREPVFEAIANTDADVMCLQEVWVKEDLEGVEKAAKAKGFKSVYYVETPEDTTGLPAACTQGDLKDLKPCAENNCSDAKDLAGCVTGKCGPELGAISNTCLDCLVANLVNTLPEILATCAVSAGKYGYGGNNGVMLLARSEMTDKKHAVLESSLIRRAVLSATVDGHQVHCTHLTAALSAIKYTGKFGSFEAEQSQQIDALLTIVGKGAKTILMGDMNTGPALKGIKAEFQQHFDKLKSNGMTAPYAVDGATCTFCEDNTLVKGGTDKGGEGVVIDHILLSPDIKANKSGRLLDHKVKVGDPKADHDLSDHYGVMVEIAR